MAPQSRNTRRTPLRKRIWADEASEQFGRLRPEMCARAGLTAPQMLVLLALAGLGLAGATDIPQGLRIWLLGITGVFFSMTILLRLAALATPAPCMAGCPGRAPPDDCLPMATLIVAAYREDRVIPRLLRRLSELNYPRKRLEIILALEEEDEETADAARRCPSSVPVFILATPPGQPQTKPRALNYALRHARGEIVAVFDAEDQPHPEQLLSAVETFRASPPDVACLQAPLNWFNRKQTWITRQFALEYAAHFRVMLPLYASLRWPLPLGGTSNYFRTAALRQVGGWDAHNVTEDADLGYRLHRAGYRSGLIAPPTLEEAPLRIHPWFLQRTRWIKGYMQTLAVHTRSGHSAIRGTPIIPLLLTIGASVLASLAHLPFLTLTLAGAIMSPQNIAEHWPYYSFALSGYLASAATAWLGMRRMGWRARWQDLATMPFYWPLQSFSALRALWQLLFNPYFWDKTEHGLTDED